MGLREELIQVAAVAVAIIEDLDNGTTGASPLKTEDVLFEVMRERDAQERKWGARHHSHGVWLAILGEEIGEAAAEVEGLTPLQEIIQRQFVKLEELSREYLEIRFAST